MTPVITVALAAGERSAGIAGLTQRLYWVAGLVAVVLAVYTLMWRAWRRRGERHADLPELPAIPDRPPVPARLALTGRYHGSTSSGDWLDRVVARGLGTRSLAELTLTGDGIAVRRQGAHGFLIPAGAVRGARLDQGIAGKVVTGDGLLVITWEHGGRLLDSGFRADRPGEHRDWIAALTGPGAVGPPHPAHQHHQEGAP